MVKSILCDYSNAFILVKGTTTLANTAATGQAANNDDKKAIIKNFASFISCIIRINKMQIDDAQQIDSVMPMYIFIEYSDNYLKTSGILWQFCRYVPVVDNDGAVTDFKQAAIVLKNVEIMVPLKYLIDFWKTLEMSLINCVIILGLNWSENCVIVATNVAAQATTISITDTKLYVPDVILSTQNNEELLEQLKSSFK